MEWIWILKLVLKWRAISPCWWHTLKQISWKFIRRSWLTQPCHWWQMLEGCWDCSLGSTSSWSGTGLSGEYRSFAQTISKFYCVCTVINTYSHFAQLIISTMKNFYLCIQIISSKFNPTKEKARARTKLWIFNNFLTKMSSLKPNILDAFSIFS